MMTRAEYIALYPGTHLRDTTVEGAASFRDAVLSVVGRLAVKQTAQICQDVAAEWGEVDKRRVQRAIAWLLERGAIVKVDGGYRRAIRRASSATTAVAAPAPIDPPRAILPGSLSQQLEAPAETAPL